MRINCAHDNPATWQIMIDNVRAAAAEVGRPLRVMMDIAGPKVRTGRVLTPPDRNHIHIGDLLLLAREIGPASAAVPFQVTCTEPRVFEALKVGSEMSIDDGQLAGTIVGETDGGFLVRIERGKLAGVKLRPDKGLNFPTTDLPLEPLTPRDLEDLDFVADHADIIGHSFVQSAADVITLQDELARRRPDDWRNLGLVGKIETPRAVLRLPEIIVAAAGSQPFAVMIARGDLAVEIGFERVAEMQEELMWLAEAAHVPVIWATQVLEGLVKKGLPSRGEMTDAAMAARTECVLLNKGPNAAAAISTLDRLLRRMGEHQLKKTPKLRALRSWAESPIASPANLRAETRRGVRKQTG
jgi:pyruvate kinase